MGAFIYAPRSRVSHASSSRDVEQEPKEVDVQAPEEVNVQAHVSHDTKTT